MDQGWQRLGLRFEGVITLAGQSLQALAIEHRYAAPGMPDQSKALQLTLCQTNGLTPVSQHVGNELLCQAQILTRPTVEALQQPSAKPLLHAVQPITRSSLAKLRHQGLYVTQHQALQITAVPELA